MISAQNPVAIIILAHFAALIDRARYSWWIRDWGQRIIHAAKRLLERNGTPHLQRWLDWPSEQLGKPIRLPTPI
jgi:hypothetical protein